MKQTINRIGLVLLLTLSYANVALADHGIEQRDIAWFSSNTSHLLNRSSVELAKNHVNRGIRFAYKALEKKLDPMDELIANHNLCMAYLALDKSDISTQYCVRAFKLAQGPYKVVKIRGAFQLQDNNVNNDKQTTLSPTQFVVSNILLQDSQTGLTLLMDKLKMKQNL